MKRYNQQGFDATVNGTDYWFSCYTTDTRNGFCHTVQCYPYTDTKVSYVNRTWESFEYETALKKAIKKCPKADQAELTAILIDKKSKEERDKANAFVETFQKVYSGLSKENKEILSHHEIETPQQAENTLAVMKLMTAVDIISK